MSEAQAPEGAGRMRVDVAASRGSFVQADLKSLHPPVVGNYKSYPAYLRDFSMYTDFRAKMFKSLAGEPREKKNKSRPVLVRPGQVAVVVDKDGAKFEADAVDYNRTIDNFRRLVPGATNAFPQKTKDQADAAKGRKKAKKHRQAVRRLAGKVKVEKLQLEAKKIESRMVTLDKRVKIAKGIGHPRTREILTEQNAVLAGEPPVTLDTVMSGKTPVQFHGPQTTLPWTPRDPNGEPRSPDPLQISTEAWTSLLRERGAAARAKRRVLRESFEKAKALSSQASMPRPQEPRNTQPRQGARETTSGPAGSSRQRGSGAPRDVGSSGWRRGPP